MNKKGTPLFDHFLRKFMAPKGETEHVFVSAPGSDQFTSAGFPSTIPGLTNPLAVYRRKN
jgi:hypothetical protein